MAKYKIVNDNDMLLGFVLSSYKVETEDIEAYIKRVVSEKKVGTVLHAFDSRKRNVISVQKTKDSVFVLRRNYDE